MCSHLKRSDNSSKFPKNNLRSKFPKYFSCFLLFIILPHPQIESAKNWLMCSALLALILLWWDPFFSFVLSIARGEGVIGQIPQRKGKHLLYHLFQLNCRHLHHCMCSGEFRTGQQRPINSVNVSRSHKFHHLGASSAENEHRGQVGGDL